MKKFDGKEHSKVKMIGLAARAEKLRQKGKMPVLASVFVASDKGSALYTKLKGKAAESIGIEFKSYKVNKKEVDDIISLVKHLNTDPEIDGILIQKPSGKEVFAKKDWVRIVSTLATKKDVDGLTPENLGLLSMGLPRFVPATVKATLEVLDSWEIGVEGKQVVIIGASEILGKPLSMILTSKGATVSLLNSKTKDISSFTHEAKIVISAAGVPDLIGPDHLSNGVVLIDVGAPKGDVRMDAYGKASHVSPVPGGVGPVTISCLLENLIVSLEN